MRAAKKRYKLPQHIVNAIRRRSSAAEQWHIADMQITAFCERLGLDTEYINRHVDTLFKYSDPEFFIRDLEAALEKVQVSKLVIGTISPRKSEECDR